MATTLGAPNTLVRRTSTARDLALCFVAGRLAAAPCHLSAVGGVLHRSIASKSGASFSEMAMLPFRRDRIMREELRKRVERRLVLAAFCGQPLAVLKR